MSTLTGIQSSSPVVWYSRLLHVLGLHLQDRCYHSSLRRGWFGGPRTEQVYHCQLCERHLLHETVTLDGPVVPEPTRDVVYRARGS